MEIIQYLNDNNETILTAMGSLAIGSLTLFLMVLCAVGSLFLIVVFMNWLMGTTDEDDEDY